ncbi:arginase family protein [Bacillus sp. RO2]|uniref:arginase family protein n=1 Tax=Bacillus sp. RO2 TaxID=2723913 RepID=UPI00145C998A|nr:arginase family protein [Bacillus sp. RO2]NMH73531.1 arginase family protein [Bacillus sp. RO2]
MKALYILDDYKSGHLGADIEFSEFFEVEKNESLQKREPAGCILEKTQGEFFNFCPVNGHPSPEVTIIGASISEKSGNANSTVCHFPSTLRRLSQTKPIYIRTDNVMTSGLIEYGNDNVLMEGLIFEDLGDFTPKTFIPENIKDVILHIKRQDSILFSLGGDHSLTYSILKSFEKELSDPVVLIVFDAHSDCGTSPYRENDIYHANFIKFLLEHEKIAAIIQIGVRGIRSVGQIYKHPKLIQVASSDMSPELIKKIMTDVKQKHPAASAYISFDIDCLDPSDFQYVDFPVSGGASLSTIRNCLYSVLSNCPSLIGVDLVEGQGVQNDEDIPKNYEAALQILIYLLDGVGTHIKVRRGED